MNKRLKCEYSILPDFIIKNEKLNATEKILMSLIISLNLNMSVMLIMSIFLLE